MAILFNDIWISPYGLMLPGIILTFFGSYQVRKIHHLFQYEIIGQIHIFENKDDYEQKNWKKELKSWEIVLKVDRILPENPLKYLYEHLKSGYLPNSFQDI